jgi:hypothetical protein
MQNSPGWVNSQQCGVGGGFANLTQIIETHDTFISGNPEAYDVETCGRGAVAGGPDFHHSISESTIGPFYAITSSVGGPPSLQVNALSFDNSGAADLVGGVGPGTDLTLAASTYGSAFGGETNTSSASNAISDPGGSGLGGCPNSGLYSGVPAFRAGSNCHWIEMVQGINELFYSPSYAPRGGGSGHANQNTPAAPTLAICASSCGAANLGAGTYNLWLAGTDYWGAVKNLNPANPGGHGTLLSPPAFITLTPGTNCTTGASCAITVTLPQTSGVVDYVICYSVNLALSQGPATCTGLFSAVAGSVTFLAAGTTANPQNYFTQAMENGFDQFGVESDQINLAQNATPPGVVPGVTHLNTLNVGGTNYNFVADNPIRVPAYNTAANCSSTSGTCGSAASGSVAIAAAATTVTVSTTAVTANSQIHVTEDSSLGSRLNVTCNTTTGRTYTVTARRAGTSFIITASAAPVTNPACLSYSIIN